MSRAHHHLAPSRRRTLITLAAAVAGLVAGCAADGDRGAGASVTILNVSYDPTRELYVDLDPNFYFWDAITKLEGKGTYDPIVQREIDAVAHKDDEIAREYGIPNEVFNDAEYGKTVTGGFKEEELREKLTRVGFSKVEFRYYWYLGQAFLVNEKGRAREDRLASALKMEAGV